MSIYRLKITCNNAQVEVVAKNGVILARELDKYLEDFLGRSVAMRYQQIPQAQVRPVAQEVQYSEEVLQDLPDEPQFVESKQDNEVPASESLSLSEFIAINKGLDIFSEFIISTYYIKKVLNENSFTLKFLNSKFYPATGTLIDLSIVEDAKNQGFINCWEEDGATRYTLSDAGEEFFVNQLRG